MTIKIFKRARFDKTLFAENVLQFYEEFKSGSREDEVKGAPKETPPEASPPTKKRRNVGFNIKDETKDLEAYRKERILEIFKDAVGPTLDSLQNNPDIQRLKIKDQMLK